MRSDDRASSDKGRGSGLMLVIILAVAIVSISAFIATADTDDSEATIGDIMTVDGIRYQQTTADEVEVISKQSGYYSGNIVIPSTVTHYGVTYEVTSVGRSAFFGCTYMYSVDLPDSLTKIGQYAFFECSSLTSIVIPENVGHVGYCAFSGCISVTMLIFNAVSCDDINNVFNGLGSGTAGTDVVFGVNVTRIPCGMFNNYNSDINIVSVTMGDSVLTIGDCAFEFCDKLTDVTLSKSLSTIGEYAFCGCVSMSSVSIPDTVRTIGEHAFDGCESVTEINVPNEVRTLEDYVFCGCTRLCSVQLPDTLATIGDAVFADCTSLSSVSIPEGVTSIGNSAFSNCASMKSATIHEGIAMIGSYAFRNCTSLEKIVFNSICYEEDEDSNGIFSNAGTSGKGIDLSFGHGVKKIPKNLFKIDWYDEETKITSVSISDTVEEIGDYAFSDCRYLISIVIPNNVNKIDQYAFSNCANLESVTMPKVLSYLGDGAFYQCSKLRSINVPEGVTSIGSMVFRGCASLSSIDTYGAIVSIGTQAFSGCSSLETMVINSGVEIIGEGSFKSCTSLTSIVLPDSLKYIYKEAFSDCSMLSSVNIPVNVTYIGDSAFSGCIALSDLYYNAKDCSDLLINNHVFMNAGHASKGIHAIFGDTAENIPDCLFYEGAPDEKHPDYKNTCNLTSVTMNSNVVSIGEDTFKECDNLTTVVIPYSRLNDLYGVFMDCCGLSSVTVLSGTSGTLSMKGQEVNLFKSTNKGMIADLKSGTMGLDLVAVESLAVSDKTFTVKESDISYLSDSLKQKIGDRPVYNFGITGMTETAGTFTFSIGYDLKEGESADDLCIWYIKSKGTYDVLPASYSDGKVSFEATHLADYAIMVKEKAVITEEEKTDNTWLYIVIIAGSVAGLIIAVALAHHLIKRRLS